MNMRIFLVSVVAALAVVSTVQADVFVEDWNDSLLTNNDWQYWVDSVGTTSTRPADAGENRDMKWSRSGGVNNSGYVWSPGNELHKTWNRYWPAYMAPPDSVASINLENQVLSINVNDLGTLGSGGTISLHFFIGEWNAVGGAGPEDDTFVFYQHETALTIGQNTWAQTTFAIGDDSQWSEIIKSNNNATKPSDLYENPQQWGFVIDLSTGPADTLPADSLFGFDGLRAVPEPTALVYWVLAGLLGFCVRRWTALRRQN